MHAVLIISLLLASCHPDKGSPPEPACGNGVVDSGEACDEGWFNSDIVPDACRSWCALPGCGDGVIDAVEPCDDGDIWGGDGCTPLCAIETGTPEVEPNDSWDEAQVYGGGEVDGALHAGDVDCYAIAPPSCGALSARLTGECPAPATLLLHAPDGTGMATGNPGADGCAVLDPQQAPGARFLAEGTWSVCVTGLMEGEVPFYALEIDTLAPGEASFDLTATDDPDGDGLPASCDDDRDGDGVLDVSDNCPDIPNGTDGAPLTPSADGFIRAWLAAGPYYGLPKPKDCMPSLDNLVADDDAAAVPSMGEAAGTSTWQIWISPTDRLSFLADFATVDPPRENYTAVYIFSPLARTLTLATGPDDGERIWMNGEVIQEVPYCQGTVMDAYTVEVTLETGWNLLLIKVHDWGGDWGNYVRFFEDGLPVTDLTLSLSPDGSWVPDQTDTDGDGVGDLCDDTPIG